MAVLRIRFVRVCVLLVLFTVVIHVVHLDILRPQRILHEENGIDDAGFLLLSDDEAAKRGDSVRKPIQLEEPPCSTGVRVKRMQEWCRLRKKPAKLTVVTWRNLYVDHQHKLLFCEVPKAGASSLKKLLIQASPLFPPNSSVPSNIHKSLEKFNITHPKQSIKALEPLLADYFKVIVVRHPITRLLSAYKDKFYDSTFLPKISRHVVQTYREKHKSGGDNPQRPTWMEFADFVGNEYPNMSERHWKTVMELCAPCLVSYDAILKLETLEKDAHVVINHISRQEMEIYHENKSKGIKGKDSQSYLRDLSPSVIEKLQIVYRHDLDLFGYKFNESAIPECYDDQCTC